MADNSNPSAWTTLICLSFMNNTMAAQELLAQGAHASLAVVLI